MKKVLIIAYYYPPLGGAGVPRTLKFAKYLPKFGWQPVVLTPEKGVCSIMWGTGDEVGEAVTVVRTGYYDVFSFVRGILRLSGRTDKNSNSEHSRGFDWGPPRLRTQNLQAWFTRFCNECIAFPDTRIGWYPFGVREGLKTIRTQDISVMYTTSPPETSHLIAHRLKEKTGIPWVADFRDLWTYNPGYTKTPVRLFLDKELEKRTLRNADTFITVSGPWQDILSALHNVQRKKITLITNGFDPDDYAMKCSPAGPKMIITYTGVIYTPGRDPEVVFSALGELIKTKQVAPERIELRFYGSEFNRIDYLRRHYDLSDSVKIFGRVSFKESIQAQLESHVLLMLDWQKPDEKGASKGVVAGKIFEYLGARRPILSLSPYRGAVTELLERTQAGVAVRDDKELRETLLHWYNEFTETGHIYYRGIESEIFQHTREHKTRQLAEVLDKVSTPK